jgi:hypothetical protein
MSVSFNKENAKKWMKANKQSHVDPKTGEVNYTSLTEDCCSHFNVDDVGGPLDDETHWVWNIASTV